MNILTITIIAVALAMDSFAVSVAAGLAIKKLRLPHALIVACWFGGFQAFLPVLGWAGGIWLRRLISHIDHWVVFGLLVFIGCKMIYEAGRIEDVDKKTDPLDKKTLFVLSLATSLDAFAVGISFAMFGIAIVVPVLIIGAVTFAMSFTGVWIGDRGGHFFEKKVEIVAGIILIGIGLKVLIEHLFLS